MSDTAAATAAGGDARAPKDARSKKERRSPVANQIYLTVDRNAVYQPRED